MHSIIILPTLVVILQVLFPVLQKLLMSFLCPITADEIQLEIAKLHTGKAVGSSSIPISILKILKSELAGPLQVIFNTSFLTGIVPVG